MQLISLRGLRFSILVFTISLCGCAGQERFQEGQRLMDAGQPEQAVTAFRDALEESPSNARYQLNLADAEAAVADKHVLQAERYLDSQQPKEAKDELLVALKLMPGHPRAAVLMNEANAALRHAGSEPKPVAAVPASKPAVAVVAVAKTPPPEPGKKVIAPAPVAASPQPIALQRLPAEPKPVAIASPPPPPAVHREAFKGTISRDDNRYKKEIQTLDGISIKVNGTSDKPLRADIQVRVGEMKREYKDLRVGTRVRGRGASRATYRLIILEVDDRNETVSFAIEPIPE